MTVVYEDNHIIIVNKTAFRDSSGRQDGGYATFGNRKGVSEGEIPETRKCLHRCHPPAGPPRERSCCICQNQQGVVPPQ